MIARRLPLPAQDAAQPAKMEQAPVKGGPVIYDPEDGVVRCICGYDHDDGFTVQCDTCFVWQHANCVGYFTTNQIPKRYLCDECQFPPKVLNVAKAKALQQRKLARLNDGSTSETINDIESSPDTDSNGTSPPAKRPAAITRINTAPSAISIPSATTAQDSSKALLIPTSPTASPSRPKGRPRMASSSVSAKLKQTSPRFPQLGAGIQLEDNNYKVEYSQISDNVLSTLDDTIEDMSLLAQLLSEGFVSIDLRDKWRPIALYDL